MIDFEWILVCGNIFERRFVSIPRICDPERYRKEEN
jgi:hypothetical protein